MPSLRLISSLRIWALAVSTRSLARFSVARLRRACSLLDSWRNSAFSTSKVRVTLSHDGLSNDTAGILLHGPPGTGKTLMARQIGKMLNAREPKIVNGPEI